MCNRHLHNPTCLTPLPLLYLTPCICARSFLSRVARSLGLSNAVDSEPSSPSGQTDDGADRYENADEANKKKKKGEKHDNDVVWPSARGSHGATLLQKGPGNTAMVIVGGESKCVCVCVCVCVGVFVYVWVYACVRAHASSCAGGVIVFVCRCVCAYSCSVCAGVCLHVCAPEGT